MKIIISEGEDVTEIFKKAITILNNMRRWQKEWGMHYGCALRTKKNHWEEKADKFLSKLEADKEMIYREQINIETK